MLKFSPSGLLPPGDHNITLAQLKEAIKEGPGRGQSWDAAWRLKLLSEFEKRYHQLLEAGISEVYVDGSFATDKPRPNDIDAYFVVPRKLWLGGLEEKLRALDPEFWCFETVNVGDGKVGYPMSIRFNIEIFPVYMEHTPEHCDCDELIDPKIDFFRTDKYSHKPKGIIRIITED